jgi:hypothetical protein
MPRLSTIVCGILLLSAALAMRAQDDEVPLGDLARAMRKEKPADSQPEVIDNDNLSIMMDQAEAERLNRKPVFSIDVSGKTFRMTSPDGTCSLSFDAKATALISTAYISSELPQYELAKLEGGATIHDGVLEVTVHNGTGWELKEVVVGLTLLSRAAAELQPASLISATDFQTEARRPDVTAIFHLKATAPAESTTVFKGVVSDDLSQAKDWHWALIAARGVPPAAPLSTAHGSPVSGPQSIAPTQPGIASAGTQSFPAGPPAPAATVNSLIPLASGIRSSADQSLAQTTIGQPSATTSPSTPSSRPEH